MTKLFVGLTVNKLIEEESDVLINNESIWPVMHQYVSHDNGDLEK